VLCVVCAGLCELNELVCGGLLCGVRRGEVMEGRVRSGRAVRCRCLRRLEEGERGFYVRGDPFIPA